MSTKNPAPKKTVPGNPGEYTLAVIEFKDGHEITHCEEIMSPEQFSALMEKSLARGDSTGKAILQAAIRMMTAAADSCALENAVAANNAFMQLLAEHMELERHESGVSSFTGIEPEVGALCFGVFQLMQICRAKLNEAAEVAS